jgi:hypothetical protein
VAAAEERGDGGGVAGLLLELSGHLLAVHGILSSPEIRQLAAYPGEAQGLRRGVHLGGEQSRLPVLVPQVPREETRPPST